MTSPVIPMPIMTLALTLRLNQNFVLTLILNKSSKSNISEYRSE